MRTTVSQGRDGSVTITVTPEPDHSAWLVFGIRDAGEPVPLAVVPGAETLAYRNDHFVGGVWQETVTADGPREAAKRGAEQARARLTVADFPGEEEEVAWPRRAG
jgi:hypothetical protein